MKTSVALYAQWKKTDQKYTIQHFDEDSNKKIHDDEYKDAKFGDIIEGSSCQLPIENFTFTKANTLTVDTDNKKNIIKVYYSKDENKDQIPDKYQIKVMYKAVNGTIDAVHENEPGNKMFYVSLYKNGKYATVKDGGIGHLSDEQIATATAARGYDQNSLKWSPKTPTTKLDLNEDTSFIAEFTKGSYDYSIEYYYDGVKGKTDTKKAAFEEVITLDPEVSVTYGGSPYALDKVKNNPLTIDTEAANNIIRVYYAKDTNGNGKPDYKEETYNVNFVAETNGTLTGTTLYSGILANTRIGNITGFAMPVPTANLNYAFDKWIVRDVNHPEGIEINDPSTYIIHSNTVFYASFEEDHHGSDSTDPEQPDNVPDKYQVRFAYVADTNGSVTGTTVEYVSRPGNNTTAAVRPQALVDAIANDGYSFMSWTANGNAYVNTDAMRNTYFTEDTVFTAGFAEVVAPILPTPVTPTPPAVTPQNPGTPIPAAPAAPQIPVNPIAPPIVVPVIPTPAPTPAPNPGPIVNEDDPDQPQGGESTEVQENPTPKGGGSQNEWALINLICAGGTVLLGLFLLLSKLKKEEEEEDEKTSAMRNDEEQSNGYKRRKWLRVASTITAVVSVIAFFLTEDITLAMVLVDRWTLLMAAFLIVQVIFVLFGRKWKELDDNKNNAETARS